MKISTKGIYALEIVTDLALHTRDGEPVSLSEIAKRRGLSPKYLERIVKALKEHQIVQSIRGARGGYSLSKDAGEMTVLEILRAVEGELAPVECLTKETDCGIDCEQCMTRDTWSGMWKEIITVVESITMEEIINQVLTIEKNSSIT